jgi:hypothetical protein
MNRSVFAVALLAAALWPAAASAQYVSAAGEPWSSRFGLEPYAGVYFDNTGRVGADFDQSGFLGGVRLSYVPGDRVRLLGDVGYARVGGTGDASAAALSADTWLATGGLEVDVVPGETGGLLGLQYGAAWRSGVDDGYTRSSVLVPSFAIRQRLTPWADLKLGVQDYIFLRDTPANHNFALTAGISLR